MVESIEVSPQNPRTGVAISVTINQSNSGNATNQLTVTLLNKTNGSSFLAPLQKIGSNRYITEFAVFETGTYRVEAGTLQSIIKVTEQRDLPFFIEFGLLATMVFFILGGLLIWNKNQKVLN